MNTKKNRKIILSIVLTAIALFSYQYLIVEPLKHTTTTLVSKLKKLNCTIAELKKLKRKQNELSTLMVKARSQQLIDSSSLASRIETLLDQLKLSEKANYIRRLPVSQSIDDATEERMEVKFSGLGFKDVLTILNEISSLPGRARIAELNLRKTGNLASLSLIVSSIVFEKGAQF